MNPCSEDTLVERPAIALFGQLGWGTANCFDEVFGDDGSTTATRQLVGGGCRKNAIAAARMRDGEKISVYTWQTSMPTIDSVALTWANAVQ